MCVAAELLATLALVILFGFIKQGRAEVRAHTIAQPVVCQPHTTRYDA